MAWLNSETYDVLSHSVKFKPKDHQEWFRAIQWCEDKCGVSGQAWADSGDIMRISGIWHFLREEDAVMFQLTWC
jgi:hypothetical protein